MTVIVTLYERSCQIYPREFTSIVGFVPEQYPRSTLKVTLEELNTPDTNRTTDRWNSYLEASGVIK